MARPRSFDTAAARGAITDVFWRKGFAAASLQDLAEAVGVRTGSLHAAFGNKDALFAEALAAYDDRFEACMRTGRRGAAAIEAYMRGLLDAALADQDHKGCLIAQAAAEYAAHAPETRAAIDDRLRRMRRFFAERLAEEEIVDEKLADGLFGATLSLLTLSRSAAPPEAIRSMTELALDRLRAAVAEADRAP